MGLILRTNRTNLPADVAVQKTRLTNVQMDNNFLYLHSLAGGSASIIQGPQGPAGPQGPQGPAGSGTTASIIEVTYSELVFGLTSSSLLEGSYYKITNFRTCYDQPDFDYQNNPITTGNYKQADIEPIIVFAISNNEISSTAYQPEYPNDRILYDWTWSETEITGGTAYGRISERIDEYNNRTDYDHRTILFKRYRLYTYREDQPLNGTIEIFPNGSVVGTESTFNTLVSGDVIYVPGVSPKYYEITTITDDFNMGVTGSVIGTDGAGLTFYKAIEEITNDDEYGGYFSYKRTNVKTDDFIEYTTFGDAISENYAKNNYVGNFANGEGNFLLANNVFLKGQYESNKFGDYCYNNTFGNDNSNNIWGDWCYQNVSTNDIDNNIIGHYFHDNLINDNLENNHIGNNFTNNRLLAENGEAFRDNIIGNGFNYNTIYSRFYKNEILDNFNNNTIGDFVNLYNFEFYRNYIRNNFNGNIIRNEFQNNQIGTNFQENEINGEFINNTILNGYNNNTIVNYFSANNIANGFNDNTVYENFNDNTIGNYFENNVISSDFYRNNIGTNFQENEPINSDLFGWNQLSTVSTRAYDTLRNSLDGNVGNLIIGQQLVMRVISTSQYFKIKFTQWTQSGNGGGFQYERQELDSNGNGIGSPIIFTKTNNGSEVDVIVEGVVELTRDSQGGLYNTITDTPPFNNQWPGPGDTEWNSIYTQENNGRRFTYNKIGNEFRNNIIGSFFGYDDDNDENENGNKIGDKFQNNTVSSTMYGNVIGNNFESNEIRRWFRNNTIQNDFSNNTTNGYENSNDDEFIGFEGNSIGNNFSQNEISYIFKDNTIGNNFNNNITGTVFEKNNIGNQFQNNKPFNSQLFGWNNLGNLTDRSFRTFQYSLDESVGQYVVGTEMIMRIISTGQYFKIIFTQWSQGEGQGGGGFSYNRQEIDSNGNNIGDIVYFTKENYGNEVDVIVEGVLEIKRGNNNVIYNVAVEQSADNDVSPADTEWNTIFTEANEVFSFQNNLIQNNFQNNLFDGGFYDNTVGNNFYSNNIHRYSYNNNVGNSAYSNDIYLDFYDNKIGNEFSNNNINIDFYDNKIGNNFNSNTTMIIFNGNTIGDDFNSNSIDSQLSGWNNLSNVAGRNYEVWKTSLNGNAGNYILDRELVMRITSTGQYFKIIFTKWTQGNGGGFSYNRQEIDSNGNNIGDIVYFTKENYTEGVDVIVEGVVEITRGEVQGIYNIATEGAYNQNTSPADTQWNSIFSQYISFTNNKIGNLFESNQCLGQFTYNTIGDSFDNNIIGNNFQWNVVNTMIDNTNFTTNYGNINQFTYTATGEGGFDDTYTLPTLTNSSYGTSSTFEIQVDNGVVIGVTVSNSGRLYQVGDTLTILGDAIGGSTPDDNIVITVTEVTVPSVYEEYTSQIFERHGGNKRLSFYDSSDILTIKNINE